MIGSGRGRTRVVVATAVVAIGVVAAQASPSTASRSHLGAAFGLQVAMGPAQLQLPTAAVAAPDGRVFVAELAGVVKVFHGAGDTQPTVFADLSNEVYAAQGHGLLGITLDPHFPSKPYVYVLYSRDSVTRGGPIVANKDTCPTYATTGCVRYARLARLTAKGDVMVPGSMKVLIDNWCNQFVHHIGALHFGADGKLYVSGGDGATEISDGESAADYGQFANACGDPPWRAGTNLTAPKAQGGSLRAQDILTGFASDPTTLDGTIIRVDPTTGAAVANNPYTASGDLNTRRIVAWGLRNPFRFAIRPGTNDLYIADPGVDTYEEIDRVGSPVFKPRNFGWPCWEGTVRQPLFAAANLNMCKALYGARSDTKPAFEYRDSGHVVNGADTCLETEPEGNGGAITGIAFYSGTAYPAVYRKALFFVDYGRPCLFAAPAGASGAPNFARRRVAVTLPAVGVVDIEPGPNGDLLLVNLSNSTIYELQYA